MPYNYEIVTDSSCNLTEELIKSYGLHVLSLLYNVQGKDYRSYIKGQVFDYKKFYAILRSKEPVTTSLVNLEDSENLCRYLLSSGKDVIYIGFSSGLSGTYAAVSMLLEGLKEAFPDRKILYIDSLSASLGQGLLVHHAVNLRNEGKTIEELYEWLLENRLHLCHWFTVDDLFYLLRGGRVSATSAIAGTLLSIKPVLHVDDEGRLVPVNKVRGRRKSLDTLVDLMETTLMPEKGQTIFISHGDCLADAQYVEKHIRERFDVKDIMIHYVEPVIASHSGPGTLALFFFGTKR